MKKCPNCKKNVDTKDKFCSFCGEKLESKTSKKKEENSEKKSINTEEIFNKIGNEVEKILDTQDTSKDYDKKDIENNKGLSLISYIGPLALISYCCNKESEFVKFHAKQGMNLLILWGVYLIVSSLLRLIKVSRKCIFILGQVVSCEEVTPWWITFPLGIIGFVLFALSIIGIIYAVMGKAKKLPLVDKINIIK